MSGLMDMYIIYQVNKQIKELHIIYNTIYLYEVNYKCIFVWIKKVLLGPHDEVTTVIC